MELHVPVPFDLDEEVVFLEQDGNMRHVAARQILLGKENAHTEWICKTSPVDADWSTQRPRLGHLLHAERVPSTLTPLGSRVSF